MNHRRTLAHAVALGVITGLVALAAARLDLPKVAAGLAVARPGWIALALVCFVAILPLWALQWRLLLTGAPRAPLRSMLGVVAMTSTVLNTAPMLVGEAAGVFFLVTRAGISRASALSLLAMDQLFVGVAKLGVLAVAGAMLDLPDWMARGAQALLLGVGALVLAVLAMAWQAGRVGAHFIRLRGRGAELVASVQAALAPMRSPSRSAGALSLALAKKLAEATAILCVQRAFGLELPPSSAVVVLAAVNLATLLPVVPGNVGVYEGAVVLAYSYLGVPPERALGIGLVQHACFFVALAIPGYRWLARAPAASRSPAAT